MREADMAQNFKFKIVDEFVVLEFDQPASGANLLSTASLQELQQIFLQLQSKQVLKGVCVCSNKPGIFIAGMDIREVEKITSSSEGFAKAQAGQKILNDLEKLPVPTVALINGACLGGGLELALACDYRLAGFGDKVKLGLPGIKLGVVPGFGGTKRLPRLVGLRKALEMILSGDPISANEALRIGLVDGLVSQNRLLQEGIKLLSEKKTKRKYHKPKARGFADFFLENTFIGHAVLKNQCRKLVLKAAANHYPAPLKALELVVKNHDSSFEQALEREARAFGDLVMTPASKNLTSGLCLVERYKKAKWPEAAAGQIKKCGLLGAGVMGSGIAQLLSSYGVPVRMKDLTYEALGRGLRQAKEIYDDGLRKKEIKPGQAVLGMGLISPTLNYCGFSNADLIIEAVSEDIRVKKSVWREVGSFVSPDAILVSGTSCLSIAQIAEQEKNKERVAGMHFLNPALRAPLIEIIRTPYTSDQTIAAIAEFSKKIGKIPIVVKDSRGFLINRILFSYLNEAGFILDEGVNFERIDRICSDFGMSMGPFVLMDEIGLDEGHTIASALEDNFGRRMKAAEILKKVYAQKWFGKKIKKGFYVYKGQERAVNREVYNFVSNYRNRLLPDENILKRLLYRMINEAAMCLQEEICNEPQDVDIAMIMGIGFPSLRAGLLKYADTMGVNDIVKGLLDFEKETKQGRFNPCSYLVEMAEKKKKFYPEICGKNPIGIPPSTITIKSERIS